MKQLMIAILIAVTALSFAYGQTDNRERFDAQIEGEDVVVSYSLSPEFEGWFVIRNDAKNPDDFFLVGPKKMGEFRTFSINDIKVATLYFNNSSKALEVIGNSLVARVNRDQILSSDGYGYCSIGIETKNGKIGFGFIDQFSSFAYNPKLDRYPNVARKNLEFRFRLNDSKGTVVPAGNIKQ